MREKPIDLSKARKIVADGEAKYARSAQMICDLQYAMLQSLCATGAISKLAFERMVAVPAGHSPPPGSKGGDWIGVRALTDAEVAGPKTVADRVLGEAITVPGLSVSWLVFFPFMAPAVTRELQQRRTRHLAELGWLERLVCATPMGRICRRGSYDLLATLNALLTPPPEIATQSRDSASNAVADAFKEQARALESSSFEVRLAAAFAVNTHWRLFNEKFPGREFERSPSDVQQSYIGFIDGFVEHSKRQEAEGEAPEGSSRGALMFAMFLRAMAGGDRNLIGAMIDELEPMNRFAFEFEKEAVGKP